MKIQVITSIDAFRKISEKWDELVLSADVENVFVTSIWMEATIENFLKNDELFIFCGWEGDVLTGALPLKRSLVKVVPGMKLYRYENITGIYTGHFDFPVRNHSIDKLKELWECFKQHIKRWDILELNYVREHTLCHQLFSHLSKNRKSKFCEKVYLGSDYLCEMQKDWETYLGMLSKKVKQNIKLSSNRLNKSDSYCVEEVVLGADFDEKYEYAKILEKKSWKGSIDSIRTVDYENFIKNICKKNRSYNQLQFLFLKIGDEYVSFLLCMVISDYVVALITGYDEEYKYYSPGQYLFCHILENAHKNGYKKIDLFHNSGTYKSKLIIGEPVSKYSFRVVNKTPQAIIYKIFSYLKHRISDALKSTPFKKSVEYCG